MRLWRAESLNDSAEFIRAVAALAVSRLRSASKASSGEAESSSRAGGAPDRSPGGGQQR